MFCDLSFRTIPVFVAKYKNSLFQSIVQEKNPVFGLFCENCLQSTTNINTNFDKKVMMHSIFPCADISSDYFQPVCNRHCIGM